MLFQCLRVRANFPAEKLCLVNRGQARFLWDEHGGTFVLRVEGLEILEGSEPQEEVFLEVALPEPKLLVQRLESFAGDHGLRLNPESGEAELSESAILAACHVPEKNLFMYCEAPQFTVRLGAADTLELKVAGAFKARRVPCQETDMVIHLDQPAMCRLLAGLLALTRKGQ